MTTLQTTTRYACYLLTPLAAVACGSMRNEPLADAPLVVSLHTATALNTLGAARRRAARPGLIALLT